ncbi:MAG: efflux RND transporter periplasmic adaptor subunit [Desulfofustis sp.]|nr:efflux RND transporter periplasmic adaptor subunit [Desulfofustis sp.]
MTPAPPAEVSVVEIRHRVVPVSASHVARVISSHQVEIMARVNGFLEAITYPEGKTVEEGQVMFRIDQKPFQTQVEAGRSEVDIRHAQLWVAQANLNRIKPLAEQDAASLSDLDNAIGSLKTAQAALAEAQARLQRAELDLSYTTIRSPISGIAGQAELREGAYITATGPAAKLTYVARLDPIWVEFSVSQNEMARTRREVEQGAIRLPENQDYLVEVEFGDGTRYPHAGKLNFADPSFNQQTGTFLVRAELPNPEGLLRPGMYLTVWLRGAERPQAVVVPQRAVLQTANGNLVFVVSQTNTAEPRPVLVGDWLDDQWIVTKGLHSGDRVIVDGLMRLSPGRPVKIVPATDRTSPSPAAGNR